MKTTAARTSAAAQNISDRAAETQDPRHASPVDYASGNVTSAALGISDRAARRVVYRLKSPRLQARQNLERARGHFQEVRRLLPSDRRRVAEQTQATTNTARDSAQKLHAANHKAQDTARGAREAVADAKQALPATRQAGRLRIQNAKQAASTEGRGVAQGNSAANRFKLRRQADMLPIQKRQRTAQIQGMPSNGNHAPNVLRIDAPSANLPKVDVSKSTLPTIHAPHPSYTGDGVRTLTHAGRGAWLPGTPPSAGRVAGEARTARRGFKRTAKGTVKTARKSVKTAEQTAKATVKTARQTARGARQTAQATARAAKLAERSARVAAKSAAQAAKVAAKAVVTTVKMAIAAIRGLVALIAAGGWVAVLIIVIICMVGLLAGSVFGIFFAGKGGAGGDRTINAVITEIDGEYTSRIGDIISMNAHDLLDMSGARANWRDVLAVYAVQTTTNANGAMDVATVDDARAALLRAVFWDMNAISYAPESIDVEEDAVGADGLPTGITKPATKTVLRVRVTHQRVDEMAAQYGFSDEQRQRLAELLMPEYYGLWNSLLYGVSRVGGGSMVEVAATQLGNVGGEVYWRWYSFAQREEWCACFVSWCAEQAGLIGAGVVPRFSVCEDGIAWFKARGQWQGGTGGYVPSVGDLIFFDWGGDGVSDHVGIVERVETGAVYTIEGNSGDTVARRSYPPDSVKFMGYGLPRR